jgi:hypothetical protein
MAQKLSQSVAKRQEFTETLVQPRPADLFSLRGYIASFGSAVWTNKRLNDGWYGSRQLHFPFVPIFYDQEAGDEAD